MKKSSVFGFIVILLVAVGVTGSFLWGRFVNTPASNSDRDVIYEVVPGKTFTAVAKDLEEQGLIKNATLFGVLSRIRGQASKMKVGEYLFRPTMTPTEVLSILTSGKSIGHNFTISEGLNIFEIAELVEKTKVATREEFLKAVQDPDVIKSLLHEQQSSLEGYLYPETYQVTKFTDLQSLLHAMVQRFLVVYAQVELKARARGMSRHRVATLASIIEKETGAPEERPLISSIFHNRLKKGMMLQTDPTVLYAKMLGSQRYELSITRKDLLMPSPYNTYHSNGLPPGPIANAGAAALRASVEPASSDYFFFVSQNNGTHIFSSNYKDHQTAVTRFQLDAKARVGKSWRDLKKNRAADALSTAPAKKPSLKNH